MSILPLAEHEELIQLQEKKHKKGRIIYKMKKFSSPLHRRWPIASVVRHNSMVQWILSFFLLLLSFLFRLANERKIYRTHTACRQLSFAQITFV